MQKMKLPTLAAAIGLGCFPVMAQVSYLGGNDMGHQSTNSFSYSWTAPTNTTSMAVCFDGDVITGGHDDITGVAYNGTALTQVGKYSGADGSHSNNRYLYLYKLNSPPTGTAHNITITSTNTHDIFGVVGAYGGSTDIGGNVTSNGPQSSSPWTTYSITTLGGSFEMICGEGGKAVAGLNSIVRVAENAWGYQPTILDTNGETNPPDSLGMAYSFTGCCNILWDDIRIMAEVLPATVQFDVLQAAAYTSSNAWVFNASDSGLASCDYEATAWDTTVSPYALLTPTSVTCDSSANLTYNFSGNQTGVGMLVANPTKCKLGGTCNPAHSNHGIAGPPKAPVYVDNTGNGRSGQFSNTATFSHTIGSPCSNAYLVVAATAGSAPSTQTVSTATYNGTNMTLLTTVNSSGSGTNADPIMWVYGLASPSSGSHNVVFTINAGDFVRAVSASYCGVGSVVYGQTTPHNEMFGPYHRYTSPITDTVYPLEDGSMSLLITQSTYTSADTATITTQRIANSDGYPILYDTKTFTNPGWHFAMGVSNSQPNFMDLYFQIIHLHPVAPLYWSRYQSGQFTASNSWVVNQTDWLGNDCDYTASAWDTTTSPYTDLTSLATFSCDVNYNITASFSANQSGKIVIVPNASNIQ
jgi:hypothetical protein